MESFVDVGFVCSIGIFNFQFQLIYDFFCYVKICFVIFQIEYYFYFIQEEFFKFVKCEGIIVIVYSFFGFVFFFEFNMQYVVKFQFFMEDDIIKVIVVKYNCFVFQVFFCWVIQCGFVVIFKFSRQEIMVFNFQNIDFDFFEEDIVIIFGFNCGICFNQFFNVSIFFVNVNFCDIRLIYFDSIFLLSFFGFLVKLLV